MNGQGCLAAGTQGSQREQRLEILHLFHGTLTMVGLPGVTWGGRKCSPLGHPGWVNGTGATEPPSLQSGRPNPAPGPLGCSPFLRPWGWYWPLHPPLATPPSSPSPHPRLPDIHLVHSESKTHHVATPSPCPRMNQPLLQMKAPSLGPAQQGSRGKRLKR